MFFLRRSLCRRSFFPPLFFVVAPLLFLSTTTVTTTTTFRCVESKKEKIELEDGFFVPMPPPIPEDFEGDVYEHRPRSCRNDDDDDEKERWCKDANVKRPSGNGRRRTQAEEEEDDDDDDDEEEGEHHRTIPLLNSAFYKEKHEREKERMTAVLQNAKTALEKTKNGKMSELETHLEELGRYLKDMEMVLEGKVDSRADDGRSVRVAAKMKTTRSGNDNDDDNRNNDGLYSSSHVSLKSASRKYYQNGEKNGDDATDLLRLASVQKFPHPITSVKFTRHRERDLKMEIYNKGGRVDGTTKTNKMKVMARVDDIVPKIALVGDEEGTLFALDVASGEILCKHDAEKSNRNAITTIESYAVSDTSDINSSGSSSTSGSSNSKGRSSNEKMVETRIILGRADGSVTFLTMRLEDGDGNHGSAKLTHFATFTTKTTAKSDSKKGSTSEALMQRREEGNQGRDVAIVASYVAVLHNGERRVIIANGKSTITILKEQKDDRNNNNAKVLSEDVTYTSKQTNTRGRIISFQSMLLSKMKRKRLRQQQSREKTDVMALTSRGEVLIISLSHLSELYSLEVVPCVAAGGRVRPFETVSDGDFEPTSSTNSARVVLDASQLAYLKVTERENENDDGKEEEEVKVDRYSCSLSSARPLKFGLSLISTLSPDDKEEENLTTCKVVSLRDGVSVLSFSSPSSSSHLFNGIRAYETNTDFNIKNDDDETYFAKDGVKFSWRDVLHDITKGEEDGEQPPDMDEGSANTAMTVATGDGRRTIAFALPSHPSVLILYRWQGGMSELERNRALMRQRQRKNAYSASDSVFNLFTRVLESKITPAIVVGVVSYYTLFVKNKDAAVKFNERARMDYAKMMHTAQHQHQQNGDPSQFKRDSRKLYREFDPKKFRKEVLVPKEKMKKMAKSNADNAPSGAPKQNSENK